MRGLPECKPGDYLEYGYGPEFSRVLVLLDDRVLVKEGVASGEVISIGEWYAIIGEPTSIKAASYFDTSRSHPLYPEIKGLTRQISIRTPSTKSVTISDAPPTVIPIRPITAPKTPWYYRLFICGGGD
jgi:hypothetical protein